MNNNGKTIRSYFIGLLAICIALPVFTFAWDDTYIELPERVGTSSGIAIEVPFDSALMASTVSRSNVYVADEQGSRIPVSREMGSGNKSIIVSPLEQYEAGKTYTLYIRKAVKYEAGGEIKNGLKLKFTVAKAAKEPLPAIGSEENLKKLLEEADLTNDILLFGTQKIRNGAAAFDSAAAAPAAAAESTSSAKSIAETGSGDGGSR